MPQISLNLITQPHEIETNIIMKSKGAFVYRSIGIVDTGAQKCLFPLNMLDFLDYEDVEEVELEQAGIAKQTFRAKEATISLKLEDRYANTSPELTVRAWFADTDKIIIGFQDILDRAALYADFRQTQTGWIEL
jgi:hypothetical protein